MSNAAHGYLRGRKASTLRVKSTSPEGWERYEGVEVRNGLPAGRNYVRQDDVARDAEIAAVVADAKRRAMENHVARCHDPACGHWDLACAGAPSPVPDAPQPSPPAPGTAERCDRCGYVLAKCDCAVRFKRGRAR